MANKSGSAGRKAKAAVYKTARRWETNRKRKLERQLKLNPNNAVQIEAALKNIVYRRRTPVNRTWSSTRRQTAVLYKRFTGAVNMDMFSNNEKLSGPALMTHGKFKVVKSTGRTDRMFALGTRAKHAGTETLAWA